ncbi:hypothetical protein FBG13_09315 [Cobetia marina]|uniref:hypothetical protein n=1 Tax=Cobetia marina TaxID=28258 RepID=UPI0010AE21B3|nr:hypothetical protein [Cobetia marina]TKD63112.1 hypothetical protein FBG13_09315 [Cobetia marina]
MVEGFVQISPGLLGGLFPLVNSFVVRHKTPKTERLDLDLEFWVVNVLLFPGIAVALTCLAFHNNAINNWLAALYLGASIPVLIEKFFAGSKVPIDLSPGQ